MKNLLTLFSLLFFLSACTEPPQTTEASQPATDRARVPDAWITDRVQAAEIELKKTEAGQLVYQAMQAHGGLEKWYANGPLAFQFDYKPRGEGVRRNTTQIVDTWSNRTVHRDAEDPTAAYGWNGEKAWVTAKDTAAFDYNLRFWAFTPIYFLAQPFNFDGAGVNLEKLADKTLDGQTYDAVKVTFADGTGDAPDDFYINYYDQETHRLEALRYIVSYPKYFKDGGHSPEKIMTLHDFKTVDGITLPTRYETYMLTDAETKGEYVTDIDVSNIRFLPETKETAFDIPQGSHILEGL